MDIESIIFVVLVSLLILSISFSYINVYIAALFHQSRTIFCIYFPIYALILILLLLSYYRAVFSSPGYSDPLDNSKYSEQQFAVFRQNAAKKKARRQLRKSARYGSDPTEITELRETSYCYRCEAVKLPRAHHCKLCDKCILRMDHHCPWVGNCIGVKNHKFFMLFLFYATVGLSMTWVSLSIDAFQDWKLVSSFYQEDAARYMMVAVIIASLLLSLSIGSLLIGQMISLGQNLTTLETFVPNITLNLPFDKGSWQQNTAEIFGDKYWLLPNAPYYETSV